MRGALLDCEKMLPQIHRVLKSFVAIYYFSKRKLGDSDRYAAIAAATGQNARTGLARD